MIGITINDAGLVSKLSTLAAQLKRPETLAKVVGREGVNQLKAHFRQRQADSPNKLGGKRQNFWRQVAQSVNSQPVVLDDGRLVKLQVSHPAFAQKLFGGTITAKRTTALTIPVTPKAYGRAASTFEAETGLKLFVISTKGQSAGFGLLAAKDASGNITVHYLLRRSVTQTPDLRALPPMPEFLAALNARAEKHVARLTAGEDPQP